MQSLRFQLNFFYYKPRHGTYTRIVRSYISKIFKEKNIFFTLDDDECVQWNIWINRLRNWEIEDESKKWLKLYILEKSIDDSDRKRFVKIELSEIYCDSGTASM